MIIHIKARKEQYFCVSQNKNVLLVDHKKDGRVSRKTEKEVPNWVPRYI